MKNRFRHTCRALAWAQMLTPSAREPFTSFARVVNKRVSPIIEPSRR